LQMLTVQNDCVYSNLIMPPQGVHIPKFRKI